MRPRFVGWSPSAGRVLLVLGHEDLDGDLLLTVPVVCWLRNWRPRVFDPAVTLAGLGELTPHELRHTAASLAVADRLDSAARTARERPASQQQPVGSHVITRPRQPATQPAG